MGTYMLTQPTAFTHKQNTNNTQARTHLPSVIMHARLSAAFASSSLFLAIFASSSTIFVITDDDADYYDKLIPLQIQSVRWSPEHVTASPKKQKPPTQLKEGAGGRPQEVSH
jgi:hypothetical protein